MFSQNLQGWRIFYYWLELLLRRSPGWRDQHQNSLESGVLERGLASWVTSWRWWWWCWRGSCCPATGPCRPSLRSLCRSLPWSSRPCLEPPWTRVINEDEQTRLKYFSYLLAHWWGLHLHSAVQKGPFFLHEHALVLHPFLQAQPRIETLNYKHTIQEKQAPGGELIFLLVMLSSAQSESESWLTLFLLVRKPGPKLFRSWRILLCRGVARNATSSLSLSVLDSSLEVKSWSLKNSSASWYFSTLMVTLLPRLVLTLK